MPDETMLDRYAEVAVRVGIGLQQGDRLMIRSSIDALDLTRRVVEKAYQAGAVSVEVLWSDDEVSRARFSHGSAAAAQVVSSGAGFIRHAFERGDLLLSIDAKDPGALAGLDVSRVQEFQRLNQEHIGPVLSAMGNLAVNWSIIAAPTPKWASTVFPDDAEEEAIEKLWSAIFRACRIDVDEPVAAWRRHMEALDARKTHLNTRNFTGLRYRAPGTDLMLGLPEGALWQGGSVATPDGRSFAPNIPTEEVFTSPHRLRADGHVTATKPVSLFGNIVDGFSFEIEDGEIVAASAGKGQDVLDQLLSADDGSARLGEAAMVPMSSAVAAEGLVWSNTLFDENDGCHIAIGRAYPVCLEGGAEMSEAEQVEAGLNQSSMHVDFVVGSEDLEVYGIRHDGGEEPIIVGGEWGFDV